MGEEITTRLNEELQGQADSVEKRLIGNRSAFFAISVIGGIAVPILPDFHDNEIKTIIEHSEAKLAFVSSGLYGTLNNDSKKLISNLILVDNFALIPENTAPDQLKNLKSSLPSAINDSVFAEVEEHDLASIIYTSGTTGRSG